VDSSLRQGVILRTTENALKKTDFGVVSISKYNALRFHIFFLQMIPFPVKIIYSYLCSIYAIISSLKLIGLGIRVCFLLQFQH